MSKINYTDQYDTNVKMAVNFNKDVNPSEKYGMLLSAEGFICFKPGLDEPNKDGKYTLAVAFPEGSAFHKQLQEKIKEVSLAAFGDKPRKVRKALKSGTKYFEARLETLIDEGADEEEIQKFKDNNKHLKGCFYINTWTKFPLNSDEPKRKGKESLLGPNMAPIDADELDGTDVVRIKFLLWSYDREDGRGITVCLNACQKLADGSYDGSGGGDSTNGFEAVPVKDGEDESNAGLSPVDKETAEPDEQEEKPAKKKAVKKTVKKKDEPVEEPEEDDDDEEYEEEDDSLSDDEVFDEE